MVRLLASSALTSNSQYCTVVSTTTSNYSARLAGPQPQRRCWAEPLWMQIAEAPTGVGVLGPRSPQQSSRLPTIPLGGNLVLAQLSPPAFFISPPPRPLLSTIEQISSATPLSLTTPPL